MLHFQHAILKSQFSTLSLRCSCDISVGLSARTVIIHFTSVSSTSPRPLAGFIGPFKTNVCKWFLWLIKAVWAPLSFSMNGRTAVGRTGRFLWMHFYVVYYKTLWLVWSFIKKWGKFSKWALSNNKKYIYTVLGTSLETVSTFFFFSIPHSRSVS